MRNATQRSLALVIALGASLLLGQATAEAKCAGPQANWSLNDGARLPAEATLYYFAPTWQADRLKAPTVTAAGTTLKATWKRASKNEAFATYKLSFDAGDAKQVVIKLGGDSQRHPIASWEAPKEGRVSGTLGPREQSRWTCSHTDVLPAKVRSKAQAFRVSWVDQRSGVEDAGHGSSIFPAHAERFWRYGSKTNPNFATFQLGHPNCFAYNIPSDNLDFLSVRVTPLFRDGSQGKSIPLKQAKKAEEPKAEPPIVEETVPATLPPVAAAPAPALDYVAPIAPVTLDKPQPTASLIGARLIGIAILLGTLFGFLVFRGHRKGVPTLRLVATGIVVSITCGTLAWAATLVAFPFWLLFVAAGLAVIFVAGRILHLDE